ncbi:hypothetical protein THASP1DRAFT_28787 [Thamnocephalis sphaerospora]|uniref:tRNA-splicing endonuclease subunit Sen54 N-terminal domain-containing protein n=1 Tax=Thamnocephalis sphaerospora TaxID=78915 RepID=A0A4P9XTD0_9FUNG|nr:hypothetical protein THASP1DRAFT_28787 [Thamnocephalis sphaerospora]|eukprot:RKP09413.1 hypothetical protein THASP1DRAFT_28787 [Thamnocephalis sphaerospora]
MSSDAEEEHEAAKLVRLASSAKGRRAPRQSGAGDAQATAGTASASVTVDDILREERLVSSRHLSQATCARNSEEICVVQRRGNHLSHVVQYDAVSHTYRLRPDEALFLLGRGALQLSLDTLVLSLQQAYAHLLLFVPNGNLASYVPRGYLRRLGYTIQPAKLQSSPPGRGDTTWPQSIRVFLAHISQYLRRPFNSRSTSLTAHSSAPVEAQTPPRSAVSSTTCADPYSRLQALGPKTYTLGGIAEAAEPFAELFRPGHTSHRHAAGAKADFLLASYRTPSDQRAIHELQSTVERIRTQDTPAEAICSVAHGGCVTFLRVHHVDSSERRA